jgi:predicted nucleic acid-binding protein
LTWCFEEEATPQTEAVLDSLVSGERGVVPAIWPFEVANGLVVAERRRRISEAQATAFLEVLTGLPISVEHSQVGQLMGVTAVARFHQLAVYDAAYLHLAARLGAKLATVDGRLSAAAARAGVALMG